MVISGGVPMEALRVLIQLASIRCVWLVVNLVGLIWFK
jgi:hypothetical protein